MRAKARGRGWILSAATLISVMGLVVVVPTPTIGQTRPNSPSQQLPQGKRQPTTVNGRLDSSSDTLEDKSYFTVHTFEGRAGESVTIDLSSSEFDAYLILVSPDDTKIAQNDNGGGGSNARITITVPTSGTYKIVVNTNEAGELGNYTLSWREATAADLELVEADQLNQQVYQLYNQGQYATAIPLAERSLAIREKLLGKEHPDVADSLNTLALLYQAQGNSARAIEFRSQGMDIQEHNLDILLAVGSERQKQD